MKEDMYNDCHSLNDDRLMVNFALNHDICANLDDRLDEKIDGMLTKMMMMMMMMTMMMMTVVLVGEAVRDKPE